MKNFKHLIALFLALVMGLSLTVSALAADGGCPGTDTDDPGVVWIFTDTDENPNQLDGLAPMTGFDDVKTTAWYYNDVTECARLGIAAGFSDGTFKPEDKVTDVQFIVMMTRTFFNDKVKAVKAPADARWYYANAKVAEDTGLSYGLTIADKAMNRYDMARVLFNELNISGKKSSAANAQILAAEDSIKDWDHMDLKQQTAVAYCYALNILTGMSDGTFSGEASMTRAQACAVMVRMLNLINQDDAGGDDDQGISGVPAAWKNRLAFNAPA